MFKRLLLALIPLTFLSTAYAEEYKLETMTITAEKRQADSQKVAIPVTVLNSVYIEDSGIENFDDLTAHIPNLTFMQGGRQDTGSFFFRGLGVNVYTDRLPVSINIDGIAWDSRYGFQIDFSNVERVEFLRGPQGTLYGKNAMGGVINFVTKEPKNETSGKLTVGYDENNTYSGKFRVSGAAKKDKLFFGLSGSYMKTDGFMTDNTPGGKKDWDKDEKIHLSPKLVYKNGDRLKAILHYKYSKSDSNNMPQILGTDIKYSDTKGLKNPFIKRETSELALKLDADLKFADITSISSYRKTTGDADLYVAYNSYPGYDNADESHISQEFRLTSKKNNTGRKWIAGFHADKGKRDKEGGITFDYTSYGAGIYTEDWTTKQDISTYSAFGETTIPLFSPKLLFTAGARYERIKKDMDRIHSLRDYATGVSIPYSLTGQALPIAFDIEKSWDSFLGKAALSFEKSENMMFYISATQGYMPGGFNFISDDKNYTQFNEQKSIDFEIGMKSTMFDKRLMLNLNIFRTDYEDLQILQKVNAVNFQITNAGKAEAYGIEADMFARPVKGLDIYGNFGVTKSEYSEFKELDQMTGVTKDYSGNKMIGSPEFSGLIGAKYRHSSGLFFMAEYNYLGTTYFDKENKERYKRKAFALVNTKVGYEHPSGLEAYIYVDNLTDKEYYTEAITEYDMVTVGKPRTAGFEISYRF